MLASDFGENMRHRSRSVARLLTVVVLLASWVVTGRALRPVESMRRRAAELAEAPWVVESGFDGGPTLGEQEPMTGSKNPFQRRYSPAICDCAVRMAPFAG